MNNIRNVISYMNVINNNNRRIHRILPSDGEDYNRWVSQPSALVPRYLCSGVSYCLSWLSQMSAPTLDWSENR